MKAIKLTKQAHERRQAARVKRAEKIGGMQVMSEWQHSRESNGECWKIRADGTGWYVVKCSEHLKPNRGKNSMKLKPCPYCGERPKTRKYPLLKGYGYSLTDSVWQTFCNNYLCSYGPTTGNMQSAQEARAAWNADRTVRTNEAGEKIET